MIEGTLQRFLLPITDFADLHKGTHQQLSSFCKNIMIGALRFYVSSNDGPEKPQRHAPDHEPHIATAPLLNVRSYFKFLFIL